MNDTHLHELLSTFHQQSLKGETELHAFLEAILTPAELEQLTTRLQIVKQLKAGRTHRAIAKDLEVGVATVNRGAAELARGSFEYV